MQNTSNYNLNLVEGTDLVNPPIQFNPNFQTIDSAMFANKEKTVGTASEVVTGTVHAIVRANQDADVFRFTATGAWVTGDTMTVDGTAVTVHLTDGTAPLDGAYVIGAEVLAILNGTLVTLVISSKDIDPGVTSFNSRTGAVTPQTSDYDASMIDYDNTLSGLTSTDVQAAIDELALAAPPTPTYEFVKTSVSGTTDGGGRIALGKSNADGYVPIGLKNNETGTLTPYSWSFAIFAGNYYLQYSGNSTPVSGEVYWIKTF